jgi:uncharacterized protein YodC (DUF2158 family)
VSKFKIGDVVVLNSGSPSMTVTTIEEGEADTGGDDIYTCWIDPAGKEHTSSFPEACLKEEKA